MLRLLSMAMQQSSKGPGGSGSNPALSDEQAEQFAASFTPAWDTDDSTSVDADATIVTSAAPAAAAAPAAVPVGPATVALYSGASKVPNAKQTMIGLPPPAHLVNPSPPAAVPVAALSSAEAIEPENVLESVTAPVPPAAPAAHVNHGMKTMVMANRPQSRPPGPPSTSNNPMVPAGQAPRVAFSADPFQGPQRQQQSLKGRGTSSSDDLEFVPKKSKTLVFVIAGLAVAASLGLFLRFALTDDTPKAPPSQVVTGPAVTTAEIPEPPPKVDPPPLTTAAATAAKTAEPQPSPLAVPPRANPEPAAPRVAIAPPQRLPRGATLPPPLVAPPPPAASPKTPPKTPNGGIVRDNPF